MDGVYYIGHSSAMAVIDKKVVLFDPVWNHKPYGDYWKFVPAQLQFTDLTKVDHCIVSHIHEDHICEAILAELHCPVTVMGGRPNLEARLNKINKAVPMEPFKWHKLDETLEIYFVAHAFNTIDSSCFVRSPTFCVYHGSDNFLDRATLDRIKADVPSVDVAMVPYAFIHWYPYLVANMDGAERMDEAERLTRQSMGQAVEFCKVMNPKIVIPFGASLYYDGGAQHLLNRLLATPQDLCDALPAGMGLPLYAGDAIYADGTINRTERNHDMMLNYHLGNKEPAKFEYPAVKELQELDIIKKKLSGVTNLVPNHEIIVNNVVIDTELLTVKLNSEGKKPFTQFNFDAPEFYRWLRGSITFEQAIGTRKFECIRVPQAYNLKVFEFMNNYL